MYVDTSIFGKHTTLKRLIKKYDLVKKEVIYIGDEIRDIEACKKAGIECIVVTWGYNSRKALQQQNPDYMIDRPADLLKIGN